MASPAKKVLVPIANGTEPMEAVITIDVLRRAGADVTVASVENQLQVEACVGVKIVADALISDCVDTVFDLISLPGGMPGAATFRDSKTLENMVKKQAADGRLYAAICAAPAVALGSWALLKGLNATCHPSLMEQLSSLARAVESRVEQDGNVVTSRGPGTAMEFSVALVEQLYGKEKAADISGPLVNGEAGYNEKKSYLFTISRRKAYILQVMHVSIVRKGALAMLFGHGSYAVSERKQRRWMTMADLLGVDGSGGMTTATAGVDGRRKICEVMRSSHGNEYTMAELNAVKWTYDNCPKILVPIADGTEEMEAVIIIAVLRRAKAEVVVASVENRLEVTASRKVNLVADMILDEAANLSYDFIVLPGGLGGAHAFAKSEKLVNLLKKQRESNRPYGAICASPALVLEPHGLLKGKKATAFPAMCNKLSDPSEAENRVVVDGNLITSRGPGTSMEFSLAIVEKLFGREKALELAKTLVVI
ncbi:hypothetical protein RJ640_004368 [Escallonia rubra]|uniref:DJ-1/PfpI domain-containing protein n=1 Tax=Escallonia rubra TaxID=112253 RepID=A0AA88UT03_9ASTE|nr:hypothetical protein RJ640_004368 [Escallonia rubra]